MENGFKIEKNIRIPPAKMQVYPISELEIGDSFFVPFGENTEQIIRGRISPSMARVANATGKKFVSRKVLERIDGKDEPVLGIRIWRLK
jgi:hypothetical protein